MLSNLNISDYFDDIINNLVFLVDTDILSDICKGGLSQSVEQKILKQNAVLLYSLPSIMELGFGPTHLASVSEIDFYRELYGRKSALKSDIFVSDFHLKFKMEEINHIRGKWVGVSPDSDNWYAAKIALVKYMNESRAMPENAKKFQIDVLLSCAAWNSKAFMWTNNIKDHLLANYYMIYRENISVVKSNETLNFQARRMPAIFDTILLNRVLEGEKFNIYSEMKKKTKNHDIIRVLEIAEKL